MMGDHVSFYSAQMLGVDLFHIEFTYEFNYRFNTDFVVIKSKKPRKVN